VETHLSLTMCACPRRTLSRSRIGPLMRSSSWAQTEDSQETVSTPPRSETGQARSAIDCPTVSRQAL
jgi:hypothetical protein